MEPDRAQRRPTPMNKKWQLKAVGLIETQTYLFKERTVEWSKANYDPFPTPNNNKLRPKSSLVRAELLESEKRISYEEDKCRWQF